jgi:hypothetical protein
MLRLFLWKNKACESNVRKVKNLNGSLQKFNMRKGLTLVVI